MTPTHTLGLVLAGGAARGAYEVGVLRYIYTVLAKRLGFSPWPDVVSGTSIGAINGVFAVTRHTEYIQRLSRLWRELTISDVYEFRGGGVLRTVRGMFRAAQQAALLDPSPLYSLVRREFPRAAMRRSLDSGLCRAFIVSATQLDNGHNTLFYDTAEQHRQLHPLPGSTTRRVQMAEQHLLASAALPFLFPPYNIDELYYVDGGLRQNTPLRPVLRMGADRILTIGAHVTRAQETRQSHAPLTPSLPFLAGKTLNALMLDPVERDLHSAEQINRILAWGRKRYGPEFAVQARRELGVREVTNLFIHPQEDLGRVAAETHRHSPPQTATPQVRWLLSLVADQANAEGGESDFLSYLYFDRGFTAQIEDLGFEDAREREEDLAAFFTP